MKKFKKTELRFEKEVVTALTGNELGNVKGGVVVSKEMACFLTNQITCKTKVATCASFEVCITQTEYNSCRCVDM